MVGYVRGLADPACRGPRRAAARIDHVGSTAVPGLAAKPVIDIMIGVPDTGTSLPFSRPALLPG